MAFPAGVGRRPSPASPMLTAAAGAVVPGPEQILVPTRLLYAVAEQESG